MRRRTFIALLGSESIFLTGCTSIGEPQTPTTTSVPEKPGSVDNHRITAVETISHEPVRRTADEGPEWVVKVTLRLKPKDPETVTPVPIGVFFIFFDAEGEKIYRVHKQVPANTGESPQTVTLAAPFEPTEADSDSFHSYRIDLVHA